jgi:hypothetical protein
LICEGRDTTDRSPARPNHRGQIGTARATPRRFGHGVAQAGAADPEPFPALLTVPTDDARPGSSASMSEKLLILEQGWVAARGDPIDD